MCTRRQDRAISPVVYVSSRLVHETSRHYALGGCIGQELSGSAMGRWWVVAPFPLNVSDVEERHIIFEAHPIKVVQGQIILHGFPKFLDCLIEFSQFRSFHGYLRCFY
jgi:hypothetical protein